MMYRGIGSGHKLEVWAPGSGKALVLPRGRNSLQVLRPTGPPHCLSVLSQVRESAQAFSPGLLCVACGSYRRGKATCGDVDVLLTHPDGRSHQGVFNRLLDSLRQQGRNSISGRAAWPRAGQGWATPQEGEPQSGTLWAGSRGRWLRENAISSCGQSQFRAEMKQSTTPLLSNGCSVLPAGQLFDLTFL